MTGTTRRRALLVFAAAVLRLSSGVLRYPDGTFESRFPLHVDECGAGRSEARVACLAALRAHLLEDTDCNRVICDNIHTSTPVEVYANQSDWVPFKNLCGNLQELFVQVFDLGIELVSRQATIEDERRLASYWEVFLGSTQTWMHTEEAQGTPTYANSTRSVLRAHTDAIFALFGVQLAAEADVLMNLASAAARRLQLFIENFSVTLLLNFHVAQLEHNGRTERGRNLVHELYGDVESITVVFHEIPGKRWDVLTHLLQGLGVAQQEVFMAEVGVEAANTSQRLLEKNPYLSYVGVDPYVNNDGLYEDVVRRLTPFMASGRFTLHRSMSVQSADRVGDASLDIAYLDARHDYESVIDDVKAWRPKVRAGGILSGHDYSWMFPTVAMAVYKVAFSIPDRTIHLAPDGMWWFQL